MSPVGYISCVTCHQPDRSFADLKARAHGLADLPRNTPTLVNLRQQKWFGWDGASDSLWMASIRPMLDRREFDSSPATVAKLFRRYPELAACYRKVFQSSPLGDPQRTLVNVGKALAAYQETLVTARTPFDEFRDGLAGLPMAPYPAAAQRGLKLFVGEAGCIACHQGPNFFKNNRLNLTGVYNDDPRRANQLATQRLVAHEDMRGQFRTPSLRNVTATPPYMHDGRMDRLQDAVRHGGHGVPALGGPVAARLSSQQADDLVAFITTLTDAYGQRRPWSSAAVAQCP